MASYDFIEASMKGYKLVFEQASYLTRIAIVPVLIKFVCFVTILSLQWEQQYIRQAIVMLPAYFAEGWLLSHLVRFIFLGQRWPFRPSGDEKKDMEVMEDRAQGIMAGTIVYALTKFLLTGLFALLSREAPVPVDQAAAPPDYSLIVMAVSAAFLVFTVWAFRFLWLYIPVAVNFPIRSFLKGIEGYNTSFYMIGTWLVCFFPLSLVFMFVTGLLSVTAEAGDVTMVVSFVRAIFQVVIDTAISVVATAGMAFSIQAMVEKASGHDAGAKS